MVNEELIQQWKDWTTEFLALRTAPNVHLGMTRQQSAALMILLTRGLVGLDDITLAYQFRKDPLYGIIESRAQVLGGKLEGALVAFLSVLSEGSPGSAVMWAHVMTAHQRGLEVPVLTLEHLVDHYPDGFPTREMMFRMWDKQKLPSGGNLLDNVHFKVT